MDVGVRIVSKEITEGLHGAMTAPGMGSFSGAASWRKTFRDSQAKRLIR
jgi:hypothetical protein